MKLSEISKDNLIKELLQKKEIQYVTAGLYQECEAIGKYVNHNIKFPEKYKLLII